MIKRSIGFPKKTPYPLDQSCMLYLPFGELTGNFDDKSVNGLDGVPYNNVYYYKNLLTASQSNVEDSQSWSAGGTVPYGTIIWPSEDYWQGNHSIGFTATSSSTCLTVWNFNVPCIGTYTFSCYVKGSGTGYLRLDDADGYTLSPQITYTSTWTRYSVTRTTAQTQFSALRVYGANCQTFYCDGFQLEPGNVATSWVMGQSGYPGIFGNCVGFNGLNSMVVVPDNTNIKYLGGDMTVSGWFYQNGSDSNGSSLISKPWNDHGEYNYEVNFLDGFLRLDMDGMSSGLKTGYSLVSSNIVDRNKWHYFAFVLKSDKTVQLYLDGILNNVSSHSFDAYNVPYGDLNKDLCIGSLYPYGVWSGNISYTFEGAIDDVRIYNRALSDREIYMSYLRGR